MLQIDDCKVEYSGPTLPDYFQGASAMFTPYDEVYIGSSSTLYDAFHDAMDGLATSNSNLAGQVFEAIGDAETHFDRDLTVEEGGGGEESVFFVEIYVKWKGCEDG